ncbi:hypothetical protein CLV47_11516 [Antricoccus suffuscus]|uniref:Secreted protein n=1 Tax=Antricoccus suffuscus TaxID=1629062 RepID=A0A2T0ZW89_9ACTN|nr:hypothetical protein [Antricoccus suffuscus]PRZ40593.1 hypothetical protein CLV47_11516 [Antricoccus suffuscus]
MAPNKTMNRAVAISAAMGAALFGIAACTSTVTGTASHAPGASTSGGSSTSSGGSGSSSGGSSSSSSDNSSSPDSSSSSSSAGGGGGGPQSPQDAAKAPGEPFKYKNGVEVKLGTPVPKDYPNAGDVLSDEEGRAFPITVTNPSDKTIDMSSYRSKTKVYCGDNFSNSEWVIDDAPEVGTPTIAPGATSNYELAVAVKKTDFGSQCVVSIIFAVEGVDATSIDPAKFVIAVS